MRVSPCLVAGAIFDSSFVSARPHIPDALKADVGSGIASPASKISSAGAVSTTNTNAAPAGVDKSLAHHFPDRDLAKRQVPLGFDIAVVAVLSGFVSRVVASLANAFGDNRTWKYTDTDPNPEWEDEDGNIVERHMMSMLANITAAMNTFRTDDPWKELDAGITSLLAAASDAIDRAPGLDDNQKDLVKQHLASPSSIVNGGEASNTDHEKLEKRFLPLFWFLGELAQFGDDDSDKRMVNLTTTGDAEPKELEKRILPLLAFLGTLWATGTFGGDDDWDKRMVNLTKTGDAEPMELEKRFIFRDMLDLFSGWLNNDGNRVKAERDISSMLDSAATDDSNHPQKNLEKRLLPEIAPTPSVRRSLEAEGDAVTEAFSAKNATATTGNGTVTHGFFAGPFMQSLLQHLLSPILRILDHVPLHYNGTAHTISLTKPFPALSLPLPHHKAPVPSSSAVAPRWLGLTVPEVEMTRGLRVGRSEPVARGSQFCLSNTEGRTCVMPEVEKSEPVPRGSQLCVPTTEGKACIVPEVERSDPVPRGSHICLPASTDDVCIVPDLKKYEPILKDGHLCLPTKDGKDCDPFLNGDGEK
ncbi:hypothetical protein K402DRAFT_463681 [Aulographum hederae CBS 113979]|uniref:Uncharacterized protein n=1 Tax=Aulographum hederae CBS 113979 TaxID=1176131 RepID=A0A6G1H004_9PEZI|nr:hypothetical protein K402DRAFT_463681 [Aulographum hederae CBS 113979]